MWGEQKPKERAPAHPSLSALSLFLALWALSAWLTGCGATSGNPTPPPPAAIAVSIAPSAATLPLGDTQQFTATVTGTTNTAVSWSVNGIAGGNSAVGTITTSGLYTAPQILPAQTGITIQAASQADSSKSATAAATVTSDLTVSVNPPSAAAELGAARNFAASVAASGNPNRSVIWSVSGSGCSGAACGTVDANGTYVAPQVRAAPPSVTLTARSVADLSKSGTAAIQITSNFTLTVSGPANVTAGTGAQYTATLTPVPNSNPSRAVSWSVSGAGCSGATCGTITATGSYTAPPTAPSPNTILITATPAADPAKAESLTVTIGATASISISPPSANVELGLSQTFSATVFGLSDPSVTWDVNGFVGGNATLGRITPQAGNPTAALYTAPLSAPATPQVSVRARSNANPNLSATAVVTLFSSIAVQLTPGSATRAVNHRQAFTAQVSGTSNQTVQWQVNGRPGGDTTVGLICAAGVNPCQPATTTSAGSVDYLAPAALPPLNPVTLQAVSQADPSKSASTQVTILAHILVSVSPPSATLAPRTVQQFAATVVGTTNQSVVWQIAGTGCGGVGAPCGSIDPTGFYTAPLAPPAPNGLSVLATSSEDTSRAGSSAVSIATGPTILALLPASATAGAAGGFTLLVEGANFVSSAPGPGSTLLLNGSARSTTCTSISECSTTLTGADLAAAGSLPVQVRNPDATASNQVWFVIVPDAPSEDVIPLMPGAPSASGKDIVVVEPSTAGTSSDFNLNIVAIGFFSVANNTCVLANSPLTLPRPTSGNVNFDICAFSLSGLDPALSYVLTGPAPNDVSIIGKQPLGLGIIHLTLQVPATAQPGPRTLFVTNTNKDKTAVTGGLEIK